MRDPLLDSLAALFDEIDPPPDVVEARPTGFTPMALEATRGTALSFHHGQVRLHLQLDGTHLTGITEPGTAIRIGDLDVTSDADGWFRTEIASGPVCVSLPELGLTTGWFIA